MSYRNLHKAMQLLTRPLASGGKAKPLHAASSAARRYCRRWLGDPNVIGFGLGPRMVKGEATDQPALRVHVLKKLPASRLGTNVIPPVVRIPGLDRPIMIDVIESEIPDSQLALVGDGVALSGPDAFFGTIGCIVKRAYSQDLYALTCRHVLDGSVGAAVEWAEFPPAPALPNPAIGTLAFKSDFSQAANFPNFTDIAAVKLAPAAVSPAIRGLGAISSVRTNPLVAGESVRLCGFGTSLLRPDANGVTEGKVMEPRANRIVRVNGHGELGFRDVVVCSHFTAPRDSGSGVLDSENRLVGIHMAGTSADVANPFSLFQPIGNVFASFGLSLPASTPAPQTAPEAHALGATQGRAPPAVGDRALAIDTLARTIWGEGRSEPAEGRSGIANAILNRVAKNRPKRFGATVEAACQKPFQFSCWNPGDPNLPKLQIVTDADKAFRECLEIARSAVNGTLLDNTIGSDHYHTLAVSPTWAQGRTAVVTLGRHRFYNNIP